MGPWNQGWGWSAKKAERDPRASITSRWGKEEGVSGANVLAVVKVSPPNISLSHVDRTFTRQ